MTDVLRDVPLATQHLPYDPNVWEVFKTEQEVTEAIHLAGRAALQRYELSELDTLHLILLKGGVFFGSRYASSMSAQSSTYHPKVAYVQTSRYPDGEEAGEPHIVGAFLERESVEGKCIEIVDDVRDEGDTFVLVHSLLEGLGVAEVHSTVLVEKDLGVPTKYPVTHSCFQAGGAWLAGAGMNNRGEEFRHLPYIIRKRGT